MPEAATRNVYGSRFRREHHRIGYTRDQLEALADACAVCKYCGSALRSVDKARVFRSINTGAAQGLYVCETCFWWRCAEVWDDFDDDEEKWYTEQVFFADAIIEEFDISRLSIPLEALRRHLRRNFADIHSIHPRRMEELMASVIREHFDCQVRLTSQTRDGGYDIYAVIADRPALIQVKRRASPTATEGVQPVRELLGVMLINEVTEGIVLSTAAKFSLDAMREAESAAHLERPYRVKLFDYSLIYDLFRKTTPTETGVREWCSPFWGKKRLGYSTRDSSTYFGVTR